MAKDILFISDLHLSAHKPAITARFVRFLAHRAAGAEALYILGDLFDAWVGDDDPSPPNNTVRNRLKALTESGVAVFVQPGNRDFLLGERFARDTGVTLLGDYATLPLGGVPTLLTHGDLLCTDDAAYQAFRARSRTAEWRRQALAKPLWLRLAAARYFRWRSLAHKRRQSMAIMDVNPEAVAQALRAHRCQRLIHGHTHRPGRHQLAVDGHACERLVLAEWQADHGSCLCWHGQEFNVEPIG